MSLKLRFVLHTSPLYFMFALLAVASLISPAHAQSQPLICTATYGVVPMLRAEGVAELSGDYLLFCTGGEAGVQLTPSFDLVLNMPVTSRLLVASTNKTEALLFINDTASPTLGTNMFQGIRTGNSTLSFPGIPITQPGSGQLILRFTNLRVNAASVAGATLVPVMAYVSVSGAAIPISNPQQTIGFIYTPGLSGSARTPTDTAFVPVNFARCNASNASLAANPAATDGVVAFQVKFEESSASAFRKKDSGDSQGLGINHFTESGVYNVAWPETDGLNRAGLADSGTRLMA